MKYPIYMCEYSIIHALSQSCNKKFYIVKDQNPSYHNVLYFCGIKILLNI